MDLILITTQKLETDILWGSTLCAKMPKSINTTPDQYSISNLRRAATTKCNCIQDGRQSSCRAPGRKLKNHGVWDSTYITYTNACGSQGITAPQQVTSKMRNWAIPTSMLSSYRMHGYHLEVPSIKARVIYIDYIFWQSLQLVEMQLPKSQ